MISFAYRLVSLLVRLGCPILILHFSTPTVLGEYYLFSTFLTFAIFLISLEAAVPFSRRYLQSSSESSRFQVFSSFIGNQIIVSAVTAIPLFGYYISTNSISLTRAMLFFLVLVTSACSNETGRFFWNIGRGDVATQRDVWRSLVFVAAIILSVSVYQTVVSGISLGLIAISEMIILNADVRRWGKGAKGSWVSNRRFNAWRISVLGMLEQFSLSLPQVLHLQFLAVLPFFERTLIDRGLGLSSVGAFSFQYAGVQAGLSLLLIPLVADTRRAILSAQTSTQYEHAHKMTFILLTRISIVAALFSLAAYLVVPFIADLMHKDLKMQPLGILAVMLTAIASTYNAAVSLLYAKSERILKANSVTLICMMPLVCLMLFNIVGNCEIGPYVFPAIAAASFLQIAARAAYHLNSWKDYVSKSGVLNY